MTDDRSEFTAAREAGLRQRHEQRLARADPQPKFVVIAYPHDGGMSVYGPYGRGEAEEIRDRMIADPKISGAYQLPLETP